MTHSEHVDHFRPHAGLFEHLALDRVGHHLVVLDITSGYLPPAPARLVAPTNQQRLAIADHYSATTNAKVAKKHVVARSAGDAVAAAFEAGCQFGSALGTKFHGALLYCWVNAGGRLLLSTGRLAASTPAR